MKFLTLALAFSAFMITHAQQSFPLWKEGAPGALGVEPKDVPTLTPFIAKEKASGAAIVVLPGGGYGGLAEHEGKAYAEWFNTLGVHAFVLKYRLGSAGYRHPRMLEDAARAVRTVRARANEWGVNPNKVGIIGSSAGGHLASTLLTHFDTGNPNGSDLIEQQSSRPDLGILCYPVITMGEYTHQGSRNNLLGKNPTPELIRFLSNELQVTRDTPPTFLFHTYEDTAVPVENSLLFAEALRKAGVVFDLHVYAKGRHGIGLANGHPWTKNCEFWLKQNGFLKD
jgi:acetyl esterase/lipase